MKSQVKITVSGLTGSGKTNVAGYILRCLRSVGADASFEGDSTFRNAGELLEWSDSRAEIQARVLRELCDISIVEKPRKGR